MKTLMIPPDDMVEDWEGRNTGAFEKPWMTSMRMEPRMVTIHLEASILEG